DPLTHFAYIVRILSLLNASKGNEIRDLPLPEILQGVIDDIGVNLTSIRSVGDLLERHFVSQATLNRYFRKYLHVSAQKYLQTQKLIYAAQLLKQGISVTEACMRSGFTDTSRFIVQFKREFAMTPKQYQTFSKQQDASQNR
ncbi:MAG: helix-turn-helix transcriptional regulator, partial [Clostridia bacterium]|nr:helix-turn-helix transcriptional regulator [Clostridia bacterium]